MVEKEIDLLIELARSSVDNKHRKRIKELCDGGVDWSLFFELVGYHRVLPLVYKNITQYFPDVVPASILEPGKQKVRQAGMKNLMFFKVLIEINNILKQHHISFLPFKGPLLAEYLYGDITLRTYGDLDILVDQKDIVAVYKLLSEHGFKSLLDISSESLQVFTMVEDDLCFRKGKGPVVEVHWELSGRSLSVPYDYNCVRSRVYTVSVMNWEFESMSNEDLVVYLCLHGTRHNWQYYELLVCLGSLLESKEIEWIRVLEIAKELKCFRAVLVSLWLVEKIYGVKNVALIAEAIGTDKKVQGIAIIVEKNILQNFTSAECKDPRFSYLRFQIKDNFLERIKFAFRLFFIPSELEWRLFRVPDKKFVFLYWLVRPLRILLDVLQQKLRKT